MVKIVQVQELSKIFNSKFSKIFNNKFSKNFNSKFSKNFNSKFSKNFEHKTLNTVEEFCYQQRWQKLIQYQNEKQYIAEASENFLSTRI